jgi:hypothetical protein
MPIKFFCGDEFPEHEYDQFKRIKKILINEFKKSKENVYLFYNFKISTKNGWKSQIDIMLLMDNKILILEMKDCDGKIKGSKEDKEWAMVKDDGSTTGCKNNFFSQCGGHRGTVIEKIKELKEEGKLIMDNTDGQYLSDENKLKKMISSWICLRGDGQYIGDVNINENPWFYVTNENELKDTLKKAKGEYTITNTLKESLVKALNFKPCSHAKDSYYFMENKLDELLNLDENQVLPLEIFRKEIENQNLNFERAEDIIFRSAIGGIYEGNEILEGPEKEEKYLVGFDYIKPIRKYERYAVNYFLITNKSKDIADTIIKKRILKHKKELMDLISKVGINAFMISLLGGEGSLNDDPLGEGFKNEYILSQTIGEENINLIPKALLRLIRQIFESNQFKIKSQEIFEKLYEIGLCNKEGIYNSGKSYTYEFYRVPVNYILRTIDIESWVETIDEDRMKEYAKWELIEGTNGEILMMKESFDAYDIIVDHSLYDNLIDMFNKGIISKPLSERHLEIVIYDERKFQEYCEDKMKKLMEELFFNN